MTTFTVKGIPDDLYQRLKERAAAHRRSINSELIVCLEQALLGDRIDPEQMLARAEFFLDGVAVGERGLKAVELVGHGA